MLFPKKIRNIDEYKLDADTSDLGDRLAEQFGKFLRKENLTNEVYDIKLLDADESEEVFARHSEIYIIKDKTDYEWALWGHQDMFLLFFIPEKKQKSLAIFEIQCWLYGALLDEPDDIDTTFYSFTGEVATKEGHTYDVLDNDLNAAVFYSKSINGCLNTINEIVRYYQEDEEQECKESGNNLFAKRRMPDCGFYYHSFDNKYTYEDFYSEISNKYGLHNIVPEADAKQIVHFSDIFSSKKIKKYVDVYDAECIYYNSKGYAMSADICRIGVYTNYSYYLICQDVKKKTTYHIFRTNNDISYAISHTIPYHFKNLDNFMDTPFYVDSITGKTNAELVDAFLEIMKPERRKNDRNLFHYDIIEYLIATLIHRKL